MTTFHKEQIKQDVAEISSDAEQSVRHIGIRCESGSLGTCGNARYSSGQDFVCYGT